MEDMDVDDDIDWASVADKYDIVTTYHLYFVHAFMQHADLMLQCKYKPFLEYKKCLVRVQNLERSVHVHVRNAPQNEKAGSTVLDAFYIAVQNELDNICNISKIPHHWKLVKRHTIYRHDAEDFIMFTFSASNKFTHVQNFAPQQYVQYIYGLEAKPLEDFLLEKNIKGPSWIDIDYKYGNKQPPSYVAYLDCNANQIHRKKDGEEIGTEPAPPIKFMSLDTAYIPMEFIVPLFLRPLLTVAATGCITNGRFNVIEQPRTYLADIKLRNYTINGRYQKALNCLMRKKMKIIRCQAIEAFLCQFEGLLRSLAPDVIVCEDMRSICHPNCYVITDKLKELLRGYVVIDLKVAADVLNIPVTSAEFDNLNVELKKPTCEQLFQLMINADQLVDFELKMVKRAMELMRVCTALNIWTQLSFISSITGCPLAQLGRASTLKQVEYMLNFEFNASGATIIVPEKKDPRKPTYIKIDGSKIIEPSVGCISSKVVTYDFRSMYPSLICQFNLEFSNANAAVFNLPQLIARLMKQRAEFERRDPALSAVIKFKMNSIFGCISSQYSSFYDPNLSNQITSRGRVALTAIEGMFSEFGTVIYGHTDSVFVQVSDTDQALNDVVSEFNRFFHSVMLRTENSYSHGIIFSKTQYAFKKLSEDKWVIKGLFTNSVPRCAQDVFEHVLDVLCNQPCFEFTGNQLITAIETIFTNDQLNYYMMHTQIHKEPASYTTATPYGSVVKRYNQQHFDGYRKHDTVSYVICNDGTTNGYAARAYTREEYYGQPDLFTIDKEYYKLRQVMPLLKKLIPLMPQFDFEPIYRHFNFTPTVPESSFMHMLSYQCLRCFGNVIVERESTYMDLAFCPSCNVCMLSDEQMTSIKARLRQLISNIDKRRATTLYYCTMRCTGDYSNTKRKCSKCGWDYVPNYNESHLYKQLDYLRTAFVGCQLQLSLPRATCQLSEERQVQLGALCDNLLEIVSEYSIRCLPEEFTSVNLDELFQRDETKENKLTALLRADFIHEEIVRKALKW